MGHLIEENIASLWMFILWESKRIRLSLEMLIRTESYTTKRFRLVTWRNETFKETILGCPKSKEKKECFNILS